MVIDNSISESQFESIAKNLLKFSIPEECKPAIDRERLSLHLYDGQDNLSYEDLLEKYAPQASPPSSNFIKRIVLVDYALSSFKHRSEINTLFVWSLIYDTLQFFGKKNPKSGLSSSGFLPVELYRFEDKEDRKILRLHIWSKAFPDKYQRNEIDKYSVHSHLFNAQSHVIIGKILDKRFAIADSPSETGLSLYRVVWEKMIIVLTSQDWRSIKMRFRQIRYLATWFRQGKIILFL